MYLRDPEANNMIDSESDALIHSLGVIETLRKRFYPDQLKDCRQLTEAKDLLISVLTNNGFSTK